MNTQDKIESAVERLVRAAWGAGFRSGHESGGDAAAAYECGGNSSMPQESDKAWKEDVEWEFENNDMESAEFWDNMP